jgi:HD-GYP domain-containing protein (c-di-GMP phosphodiesterase class II)
MLLLDSRSRLLAVAFLAMGLGTAAYAADALIGAGHGALNDFFQDGVYTAIEFVAVAVCFTRAARRRADRAAWLLIGVGLLTWTAGDLVWTVWLENLAHPPYPSIADGLYLVMYPAFFVALLLMMRSHFNHVGAAVWFDGLVVGLTTAAVGAAVVFPAVLAASKGSAAAVEVNLAYPLGDLFLLVFVALAFALSGGRPGRQWAALALGIVLSAAADLVYVYEVARGTFVNGGVVEALWPAAMAMIALAAWQPRPVEVKRPAVYRHTIVLPAAFGLVALTLMVDATVDSLSRLSVALAAGALLAVGARTALTYVENLRLIEQRTRDAVTDALTGLGSRRQSMDNLNKALMRRGSAEASMHASFARDGADGGDALAMHQSVLMQLLTEREPTLRDHVCDVGVLAVAIGRQFKLGRHELDELRRAAELHDLGKLAIPDQILQKPGPLSDEEWLMMREHTIIGERILNAAPALAPVGRLVRSSHERWDGAGYPDGLAGEDIPLGARIIAVCDAYDAMISERSYDKARPKEEAIAELKRHAGTQFDRDVVEAVCRHLEAEAAVNGQAVAGANGNGHLAVDGAANGHHAEAATAAGYMLARDESASGQAVHGDDHVVPRGQLRGRRAALPDHA